MRGKGDSPWRKPLSSRTRTSLIGLLALVLFSGCLIRGQKFNDLNGDGTKQANEPGLPGWTIFLDLNRNGNLDDGEPTDVTDADGNYEIEWDPQEPPGPAPDLQVKEVLQASWLATTPNPRPVSFESFDLVGSGESQDLVASEVLFGNFKTFSILGRVFEDSNGNAELDSGEQGLGGWTVFIDKNGNGVPDSGEPTSVTDDKGNFSLDGIGPGTHKVRQVLQSDWSMTTPQPGDIAAQSGNSVRGLLFGNRRTAISITTAQPNLATTGAGLNAPLFGTAGIVFAWLIAMGLFLTRPRRYSP